MRPAYLEYRRRRKVNSVFIDAHMFDQLAERRAIEESVLSGKQIDASDVVLSGGNDVLAILRDKKVVKDLRWAAYESPT